jgi:hypothetical protein
MVANNPATARGFIVQALGFTSRSRIVRSHKRDQMRYYKLYVASVSMIPHSLALLMQQLLSTAVIWVQIVTVIKCCLVMPASWFSVILNHLADKQTRSSACKYSSSHCNNCCHIIAAAQVGTQAKQHTAYAQTIT